ncbi:iron-sulfur cluster insertion protein ErpA [Candidatus Woesearchaeota archaeon]|nr:iron-sulfur cluster insertion protein ErpA [Candidatus Woesearchaeota archaeon]
MSETSETQTQEGYQQLQPYEYADMIGKDDVIVLDVRTREEFEEDRIDGAVNIPVDELNPLTFKELDKEKRLLVICRSGNRSKAACKFLYKYFQHLYHAEGGMIAYNEYMGLNAEEVKGYTHADDEEDHRLIKPSMTIGEVVAKYPDAAEVMLSYGLHCIGCHVNPFESIEQGAMGHGMSEEEFENLMKDVNAVATKTVAESFTHDHKHDEHEHPELPETITLTKAAIAKIKDLLAKDSKQGFNLRVQVVPGGCSGFKYSLSFDDQAYPDDAAFEQDGFKIVIDPESMSFMKGASIDYVDGLSGSGFKIENPNAHNNCGCGKSFG